MSNGDSHFVFLVAGIVVFAMTLAAFQMNLVPEGNVSVAVGIIMGIVSMALIVYGGGWRSRAIQAVGLVAGAVLVCSPFWDKNESTLESNGDQENLKNTVSENKVCSDQTIYRDKDLAPLFAALGDWDGQSGLVGVWVHGGGSEGASVVSQFLGRLAQTASQPQVFGDGNADNGQLVLVKDSPLSFTELAQLVRRIGEVEFENPENHLVDVTLNAELFAPATSAPGMVDPANELFISNNMRELANPDVRRVLTAARRLANPSVQFDEEQARKMAQLLMERLQEPWGNDPEYPAKLAETLVRVAPANDPSVRAMLVYVASWLSNTPQLVSQNLIAYLLTQIDPASAKVVLDLWDKDPIQWEGQCMKLGSIAENKMIDVLNSAPKSSPTFESAMRVLCKCGSRNSLPILRELGQSPQQRTALFAQLAIDEITSRLNEESSPQP